VSPQQNIVLTTYDVDSDNRTLLMDNLLGRMGIPFLMDELSAMNALLERLEDADGIDPQAKSSGGTK
jgi:hypothetical protein